MLVVIGLLSLVIFPPRYGTNDDIRMLLTASGQMIVPDADVHILFGNVAYGGLLTSLYSFLPDIPWHGLILIFLQFCALYCWHLALPDSLSRTTTFLIFLLFHRHLFQYLQFTSCSILLAQSASLAILKLASKRNGLTPKRIILLAGLLLIAGLIRPTGMLLGLGLMLPYFSYLASKNPSIRIYASIPAIAAVITLAGWQLNVSYYNSSPEWEGFYEANKLRAELTDYDSYPYEAYKTEYQQVGWDSLDVAMYKNWFLIDTANHRLEDLQQVVTHADASINFHGLGQRLLTSFKNNFWLLIPFLGAMFLLPFINWTNESYQVILVSFVWILGILGYLAVFKWLHMRVSYPVVGSILLISSTFLESHWKYSFKQVNLSLSNWRHLTFTCLLLFCFAVGGLQVYRGVRDRARTTDTLSFIQQAPKDLPWLTWADSFPYENWVLPLNENRKVAQELQIIWPDMLVYTPLVWRQLEHLGVSDPISSMKKGEIYVFAREEYRDLFEAYADDFPLSTRILLVEPHSKCEVIQFGP